MSRAMVSRSGVALAVSLDTVNAFNTIPWDEIVEIIEFFFPTLFVSSWPTCAYRWVRYTGKDGEGRRPVRRGDFAGLCFETDSVDHRLRRGASCPRAQAWCVTLASRWPWLRDTGGTRHCARSTAVTCVVRAIGRLGLRVIPVKVGGYMVLRLAA